ncbi:MAG: hypothetical protein IT305_17560 [Chloroflexi bacterium]|nr:hypothetical protein [Chloroflexota bacterium]
MPTLPPSNGPASGPLDASAATNATAMLSAAPVPALVVRFIVDLHLSTNGGVHAA